MIGTSEGTLEGRLIALEGIDGCGKSTQARLLAEATGALLTFEPGDTALGRRIRSLILGDELGALGPVPRAEALLLAADRAQHVAEVIDPAISEGRWVVSDRFSGSTLAYQGWGRGLELDGLRQVAGWAAGGRWPDLSVLVDVPVDLARQRKASAAPDRLERLGAAFDERVQLGFRHLAFEDPERWLVVDGTGTVDEVAAVVTEGVRARLGWPERQGS
jgi:dTMP kinase